MFARQAHFAISQPFRSTLAQVTIALMMRFSQRCTTHVHIWRAAHSFVNAESTYMMNCMSCVYVCDMCIYIYIYIYVYVCMYVCMCIYIYIYIYIYTHICWRLVSSLYISFGGGSPAPGDIDDGASVTLYIHMCICMCVYIYIYIWCYTLSLSIYIYIYIYIHTIGVYIHIHDIILCTDSICLYIWCLRLQDLDLHVPSHTFLVASSRSCTHSKTCRAISWSAASMVIANYLSTLPIEPHIELATHSFNSCINCHLLVFNSVGPSDYL